MKRLVRALTIALGSRVWTSGRLRDESVDRHPPLSPFNLDGVAEQPLDGLATTEITWPWSCLLGRRAAPVERTRSWSRDKYEARGFVSSH